MATAGSFLELKKAAELDPASAADVRARRGIVEAEVSWTIGKYDEMEGPLADAASAADELGGAEGRTLRNSALGWMARSLLLGPTPAEEARRRCDEILEEARGSEAGALEAAASAVSAGLHAMLDDFEEARKLYRESRRIGEARGLESWLAALPLYSGPVELLARRPDDARRQLRRGRDLLERMGDRSRRATTAAFLAQALCEQQRDDEALRFVREAKGLAGADDVYTQVVWRGALAKVLARRGERDRARERAEEAVKLAEETDGLNLQGDAYLDLAEVQSADDPSGARENAVRARDLYERKGNVAAVGRANAFIVELPS